MDPCDQHVPRHAVLELTLGCTLRCRHCGSAAGRPRDHELETNDWLEVVDELAALGCETITLSGGEPTLRTDWDRIAEGAAARGIYVNMITNGAYPKRRADAVARRALDAGLGNLALSLDGPEAVHEQIRGAGTFGQTLDSAARFNAAGLPVAAITTVSALNLAELEAIGALVVEAGAFAWMVQLAKPMGNLRNAQGSDLLRPDDVLELLPRLADLKRALPLDLFIGDSIGYFGPLEQHLRRRDWRGRTTSWQGCQAGLSVVGVESGGAVKGCLSLQARRRDGSDPFVEGDVREAGLTSIWRRPGSFAYNRGDGAALSGHCAGCAHARRCRGGARCVAAAVSHADALGYDPYCFHGLTERKGSKHSRWIAAAAAAALLLGLAGGGQADSGPSPQDAKVGDTEVQDAGVADQGPDFGIAVAEYSAVGCSMLPIGRRGD